MKEGDPSNVRFRHERFRARFATMTVSDSVGLCGGRGEWTDETELALTRSDELRLDRILQDSIEFGKIHQTRQDSMRFARMHQ